MTETPGNDPPLKKMHPFPVSSSKPASVLTNLSRSARTLYVVRLSGLPQFPLAPQVDSTGH